MVTILTYTGHIIYDMYFSVYYNSTLVLPLQHVKFVLIAKDSGVLKAGMVSQHLPTSVQSIL